MQGTREALEQLTFSEMIERIQRCERIIFETPWPGVRLAYQQLRDRLYQRCVAKIDNVLSDGAFSVFLSLDNASITINP